MIDGGDDNDDGGVGVGGELVGTGGVKLPTGSAEAFRTVADVGGRSVFPRFWCVAVAAVISVVVVVVCVTVVIRLSFVVLCHRRTTVMFDA